MNETAILQWFHDTWLGVFTREAPWAFATFETLHFAALCVLFGSIAVLDLRLLGFARMIPIGPAMKFIPVAIGAFAVNLLTGIAFFCADPFRYWANIGFKIKMVLILLAGLNALWFWLSEHDKLSDVPEDVAVNMQAKVIAGLSLGLWLGVIVLGRLIPYVGSG